MTIFFLNNSAETLGERLPLYSYSTKPFYATVFGVLLCLLMSWKALCRCFAGPKGARLPIVDQGEWWDVFNLQPIFNFYLDGRRGLENAYRQARGKPFRMLGVGVLFTIMPPEYAHEIRNDTNLDFGKVVSKVVTSVLSIPY